MSRVFLGRGYGMDVHNSAEWKRLCAQEDRFRLLGELKQQQQQQIGDDDAASRADTATLEKGLCKVVGDGKIVGWVNSQRAQETFRPRTRFPSPPPLPFAQNVEITNAQGKVIKMTRVIHVPRYGATKNSMYGTTYHQKAVPEHWQRPQEEQFPGTVVKASAGHFLKDDGYWEFGENRPSRVGRPLWHSFGPRPNVTQDGEAMSLSMSREAAPRSAMPAPRSAMASRRAMTSRGSKHAQINDRAREVEMKAANLMQEAQAEVDGLKWVRSLGFMRTNDAAENTSDWQRPESRTLRRLIPRDQRGPTASSVQFDTTVVPSTMPAALPKPISGYQTHRVSTQAVRVQTPHEFVQQQPLAQVISTSAGLPTMSPTSPRRNAGPVHKPAFPATFRFVCSWLLLPCF